MKNKITIIGAGSFGTAISQILTDNEYDIMLYTNDEKQKEEINNNRTNSYYFKDFKFSDRVEATTSLKEAMNFSNNILIALPSAAIREVLKEVNNYITEPKLLINVSKGIEPVTDKLVSEIIEEEIDKNKSKGIVVLSGPSFAVEIIDRNFTALVAASANEELAKEVQQMFSNEYMRVYTSTDIIGVQIAGAIKNVVALAAGIITGMGYGENARAALITRGVAEMCRYGINKGANATTFMGLAGIGDLMLTATSYKSRNFLTGLLIGEGKTVKDALATSKTVVEGVRTVGAIYLDAQENKIEMPIVEAVYGVFYKNKHPMEVIENIVSRELIAEVDSSKKKELVIR